MTDYKPQERRDLEELYRKQNVRIVELEQENAELKEKIKRLEFDVDAWHQLKLLLEGEIERLKSKTITVTDEDNRIILEKGEDGKRHSY